MKRLIIILFGILFLTLASCQGLDVIGNDSISAFEEMLNYYENNISYNSNYNTFELVSPDNSTILGWCADYSVGYQNGLIISVDASVFLKAGLNESKLPDNIIIDDDRLIFGVNYNFVQISSTELQMPLQAYKLILGENRYNLSFHSMGDHFSLKVGEGNSFEWAKDMLSNESDIVFMLDPQILTNADADITKIQGWELRTISVHSRMTMIQTEKLVKSFNIK